MQQYLQLLHLHLSEIKLPQIVVFFFYFENGTYVLLHQYRKKTQKTPKREIKKAKQERKEYLQKKEKENENME